MRTADASPFAASTNNQPNDLRGKAGSAASAIGDAASKTAADAQQAAGALASEAGERARNLGQVFATTFSRPRRSLPDDVVNKATDAATRESAFGLGRCQRTGPR